MSKISSMSSIVALCITLILPATFSYAQGTKPDIAAIEADIVLVEQEILKVEASNGNYEGGALAVIAALNLETLRLTKSVLEARVAAEENGTPIEVVVPAVKPNPELAAQILADIQTQQINVETAKKEAAGSGGLMAALALTRYETEKLSLAQLRQAWFRAQYGIAFPTSGAPQAPASPAEASERSPEEIDPAIAARPDWADPEYPAIDYDIEIFKQLSSENFDIVGWWGVLNSRAEIDDSPQIFAINVSDYGTGFVVDNPSMQAACIESEARLIFNADTYITANFQSSTLPVTVRIGDMQAETQRWSKLTNSQGAGLFGSKAEAMMRKLMDEEKVFLRITGERGKKHDLSVKLDGAQDVFEAVAVACQFSLLDLSRDDFKAIQTLLNASGFDAGTPDGQWGSGSRKAMSGYQASVGLPETGAPDRATLVKMGILQD